jgi:AraC-like DNA-binding protein
MASDGSSGTLYLPRDMVEELIPQFSRYHGSVLGGAAGKLLAGQVASLGRHLPGMSGQSMSFLADSIRDLALGCLIEHVEQGVEDNGPVEHALRRDVERFIEHHLGDPGLCATSICAAFTMSRTTLYRLFDRHVGVAAYIKSRRLHRIRMILIADQDSRPLVEIAEDFGFRTGAHFSREFRVMFGYPPSEIRAGSGVAPRLEAESPDRSQFERIFRSLYA